MANGVRLVLACLLLAAPLDAQEPVLADTASKPETAVAAVAASAAAPECGACISIPALTPVKVEIMASLGSKVSKSGDTFPLRLAEAISADGREILPKGTAGIGEVVHAKKSGGSGSAGELVLAARYLDVGGRHLRLRSMHLASEGRSNIGTVNAINIGSAASPLPIGLIGFFITGGQTTIPQGTLADAKTAEIFSLDGEASSRVLTPAPETVPDEPKGEGN